jgi:hypothetical protein
MGSFSPTRFLFNAANTQKIIFVPKAQEKFKMFFTHF